MSGLDVGQLRLTATRAAAEEIARGHGDDDIEEVITHHLLTYGPDDLTLGELREIADHAFQTAIASSMTARHSERDERRGYRALTRASARAPDRRRGRRG